MPSHSKARESGREGSARRKIGFLLTYGGSSYMLVYAGKQFRQALRDLGLTSNQVWGAHQDRGRVVIALDAALATTRREDLKHGTNAAYVAGCVCKECREHQRVRMAKNGGSLVPSNQLSEKRRRPGGGPAT